MRSAKDELTRQRLIGRPIVEATRRDVPTPTTPAGGLLGVIVGVPASSSNEIACVKMVNAGISLEEIPDWSDNTNTTYFDQGVYRVWIAPGSIDRRNLAVVCIPTQCDLLVGLVIRPRTASYAASDPENRTCEPSASDLLADDTTACPAPDWWGGECGE